MLDVAVDCCYEVVDGVEDARASGLAGELGKEALDGVQPGAGCRGEVERPSRIVGQPSEHLGVLVGSIVVHDGVDHIAGRYGVLDLVEKGDELLVAMARSAAAEHGALQRVQGGEQRGGTIAHVIVSEGRASAGLERQSWLGAVQGLDLALLIHRQHDRVTWWREVEAHHIVKLGRKPWVGRAFEGRIASRRMLPDKLIASRAMLPTRASRPGRSGWRGASAWRRNQRSQRQ